MPDAARSNGVVVVIPTFNEAESIAAVVAGIPRDVVDRVIVADGGSRDGTEEIARRAGAEVIVAGRGYGLACLRGAQAAQSGDIIVFMDGVEIRSDQSRTVVRLMASVRLHSIPA